jgi:hypothetical protein
MTPRGRTVLALLAGAAVLLAGVWLWRRHGLEIWLTQAIAYCL